MDFGPALTAARHRLRMSQEHLAGAAGVSRRTVIRAEAGNVVSGESLRCLCAVLGVDCTVPEMDCTVRPHGEPGVVPLTVVAMGWLQDCDASGALAYARSYALRHMDSHVPSFGAAMPFRDGYLWEVHGGGTGIGYLPAAVETLSTPGKSGWFPVRKRAFRVSMLDGYPALISLPERMSADLREDGGPPMVATGLMGRISRARGATVHRSYQRHRGNPGPSRPTVP